MKQHYTIVHVIAGVFITAVLFLVSNVFVQAQMDTTDTPVNMDMPLTKEKLERIEVNLVKALESTSVGICIGGAQTIREVKAKAPQFEFAKAIIPLMRILKDKNADRAARMMASLALYDINADRGNFAIKREAELSDDPLLKVVCLNLTQMHKAKEGKK